MSKMKSSLPFLVLIAVSVAALFVPVLPNFDAGKYSAADIGWIIVAAALVFLMTPGLAFFYGGMVNRKNVLSTMMKSVVAAGVVGVLWIVVGYSLCFGDDVKGWGFVGNPLTHLFYKGVASGEPWSLAPSIPKSLFFCISVDVCHHYARPGSRRYCGKDAFYSLPNVYCII